MRLNKSIRLALASLCLLPLALTGCQSSVGGQTLPSAYYLQDDVQYFPSGPEFKLSNAEERYARYRLEQGGDDTQDDVPAGF